MSISPISGENARDTYANFGSVHAKKHAMSPASSIKPPSGICLVVATFENLARHTLFLVHTFSQSHTIATASEESYAREWPHTDEMLMKFVLAAEDLRSVCLLNLLRESAPRASGCPSRDNLQMPDTKPLQCARAICLQTRVGKKCWRSLPMLLCRKEIEGAEEVYAACVDVLSGLSGSMKCFFCRWRDCSICHVSIVRRTFAHCWSVRKKVFFVHGAVSRYWLLSD